MPNNPNNTTPVLTPDGNLAPSQQSNPPGAQPYVDNGLTYQSNNPDFVERDDNGNIIVNQGVDDNQNLVLEAVSLRYVNASVVQTIDTRFKYFKFPAENVAVPEISFKGFGIDDLTSVLPAEYRPSENFPIRSKAPTITGILMDVVVQGQPQTYTNTFEVTREIKESGADLRFAGRLVHNYNAAGELPLDGGGILDVGYFGETDTIFFTLIKSDYETGTTDRDFRVLSFDNGTITQATNETIISPQSTNVKTFNIVIPNSDFNTGDLFWLGVTVGQYNDASPIGSGNSTVTRIHNILRFGSTWLIRNADDPFDIEELADPN
jgi:hypothetical protein